MASPFPTATQATADYESVTTPTDGTAYGYGQMYDPSSFRQTPFHGYGAQGYGNPTRGNGQGRNRGGRDARNGHSNGNGGGGYRAQQAPQQYNQAFINPAFPVSPFQSSSGSQVDVQESLEDGGDAMGMAGYPDGQGYHAMSGMVLPGESFRFSFRSMFT
jgi:hypothetical protein